MFDIAAPRRLGAGIDARSLDGSGFGDFLCRGGALHRGVGRDHLRGAVLLGLAGFLVALLLAFGHVDHLTLAERGGLIAQIVATPSSGKRGVDLSVVRHIDEVLGLATPLLSSVV